MTVSCLIYLTSFNLLLRTESGVSDFVTFDDALHGIAMVGMENLKCIKKDDT